MRSYELTLVFSPLLEEQEVNDALQAIASAIQDKGGILGEQNLKGKQALHGTQQEGYLAVLAFTVAAEYLPDIEKTWKDNTRVTRFLLMQHHKKAAKAPSFPALASSEPRVQEPVPQAAASTPEKPKKEEKSGRPGEEKVNLKDIDEKLEEIFSKDR